MKKIIYIEKEIINFKRTRLILNKFKNPEIVVIDRYSEVFNKKNQSFRKQKPNPAIILARKYKNFILNTPDNYGIGNLYNYYFSYMYNCIFDCKYCFLQGLYSSANHVIFINYEDFIKEIFNLSRNHIDKNITLFSGYDCDSLAYEPISGFMNFLIKYMDSFKNIDLEIRTKSTYIEPFIGKPKKNIIIAYSFTPDSFSNKYEIGVPKVNKRIASLVKLSENGWKVGIRFDPIIVYDGWEKDYLDLFENIFKYINTKSIHSISLGKLRLPVTIYKNIMKDNLSEKLFLNLEKKNNIYEHNINTSVEEYCKDNLKKFINEKKIYFNN
tara:strand:- start:170 stop:1147 length:978 start_codon:yes stop_codon:yes gene_type:complete